MGAVIRSLVPLTLLAAGAALVMLGSTSAQTRAQSAPPTVASLLQQGDDYLSHHSPSDAMTFYSKADSLAHHHCAECYLHMSIAERQLGDFDKALDDVGHALTLAAGDDEVLARAHMDRGALLLETSGRPDDSRLQAAVDDFKTALSLDPELGLVHFDLGMAYIRQADDTDGAAELQAYIALPDTDPVKAEEASAAIADPVRVREPLAPNYSFITLDSQTISNATMVGKVVLLDFWATWCEPCRRSLLTLQALERKHANQGVMLIGVSVDTSAAAWRAFLQSEKQMDWPEALDANRRIQLGFHVTAFPTYIVLDGGGRVVYRVSGFGSRTKDELDSAIHQALKTTAR